MWCPSPWISLLRLRIFFFFSPNILCIWSMTWAPWSQHLAVVPAVVYVSVLVVQISLRLHSAKSGRIWSRRRVCAGLMCVWGGGARNVRVHISASHLAVVAAKTQLLPLCTSSCSDFCPDPWDLLCRTLRSRRQDCLGKQPQLLPSPYFCRSSSCICQLLYSS